jgi:APA family basic amino acid/polyamine antiporter
MFGNLPAFLYGWAAFAVINTAGVAAISFVCAQYADYFLHLPRFSPAMEQQVTWHLPFIGDLHPLENFGVKSLAIFLNLLFAFVNYFSTKASSVFQVISTVVKVGIIGLLIFGIFLSGNGSVDHFWTASNPKQGGDLLTGIIAAMTGAFFAYDGWINLPSVAGEVKDPKRNIPRSLFTGVIICILVYVLVNQAYLYALPVEAVASSTLVASDAMTVALGKNSGAIIAAMVVLCTLGALNGNTMANARITYAMGKDRVFIPWVGKVHPRFQTPANALLLHVGWTTILVISGSFDLLADMMVFITWIAYGLGAIGVFILRKKMPAAERPYRVWAHPLITIIFILLTFFFLFVTVYNDVTNYTAGRQPVINSLLGVGITLLGVPLFFYYRYKYGKNRIE